MRSPFLCGPGLSEGRVDLSVGAISAHLLPIILRNCIKDHCRKDSPTEGKEQPGLIVWLHLLYLRQDQCLEVSACSLPAWKESGWRCLLGLDGGVTAG